MNARPMESCRTLADLRPGDIGFGPLSGAARLAMWGQAILGEGFSIGDLNIGHVFVVHDNATHPRIVEAMPRGARERALSLDQWSSEFAYVRLAEDYPGQSEDAAAIARAMIGTPYSFLSYAALALWRIEAWFMRNQVGSTTWRGEDRPGMGNKLEAWINRRKAPRVLVLTQDHRPLSPSDTMTPVALPCEAICSVLADQAWSLTGKKIMHGVAHQCVTPGALARRLLEMAAEGDGACWTFPK